MQTTMSAGVSPAHTIRNQAEELISRIGSFSEQEIAALMSRVTAPMVDSAEPVFVFSFFPEPRQNDRAGVLVPSLDNRGTRESIRYYKMPASPNNETVAFARFAIESYALREAGEHEETPQEIAKFNGPRKIVSIASEAVARSFIDMHYSTAVSSDQEGGIGTVIIRGNRIPSTFTEAFMRSDQSGTVKLTDLRTAVPEDVYAEIMAARDVQMVYVQWVLRSCNTWYTSGEAALIKQHHRRMAQWGIGDVSGSSYPWYGIATMQDTKSCFLCAGTIARTAKFCSHCKQDLLMKALEYYQLGLPVEDEILLTIAVGLADRQQARRTSMEPPPPPSQPQETQFQGQPQSQPDPAQSRQQQRPLSAAEMARAAVSVRK